MAIHHLTVDSPHRPPDYRWQRAQQLRAAGRPLHRLRDDTATATARRFQTELEACQDDWDLDTLRQRQPTLFDAYDLFSNGEPALRYELEARLLSHVPVAQAARKMGLAEEAASWYEKLFFSVLDRLDNPGWVIAKAIGPAVHEGRISDNEYHLVWKLFAYGGGEKVLDSITGVFMNPVRPQTEDEVRGFYAIQARGVLERKHCQGVVSLRCHDAYTRLALGELRARYADIEKAAGQGGESDALVNTLAGALMAIHWGVGESGNTGGDVPRLGTLRMYDSGDTELRSSELLAVKAGGVPAGLTRALAARFPDGPVAKSEEE